MSNGGTYGKKHINVLSFVLLVIRRVSAHRVNSREFKFYLEINFSSHKHIQF